MGGVGWMWEEEEGGGGGRSGEWRVKQGGGVKKGWINHCLWWLDKPLLSPFTSGDSSTLKVKRSVFIYYTRHLMSVKYTKVITIRTSILYKVFSICTSILYKVLSICTSILYSTQYMYQYTIQSTQYTYQYTIQSTQYTYQYTIQSTQYMHQYTPKWLSMLYWPCTTLSEQGWWNTHFPKSETRYESPVHRKKVIKLGHQW